VEKAHLLALKKRQKLLRCASIATDLTDMVKAFSVQQQYS
jgi:hypothetical protein